MLPQLNLMDVVYAVVGRQYSKRLTVLPIVSRQYTERLTVLPVVGRYYPEHAILHCYSYKCIKNMHLANIVS